MTKTVTVLGTGIMGAGMARNLIGAGLDVTVWNRSPDRARPLADAGARIATDAAEAVAGADVVVTMLFDADSVAQVMEEALPAMAPDAVWVQTSTVGLEGTERLAALAARHDVAFLDAPVLGTKAPAEQGTLTVLVGGPSALRDAVTPVFDAIGSKTIWVGEQPGDGHKLKLVANSWVGDGDGGHGPGDRAGRGPGAGPAAVPRRDRRRCAGRALRQLKGKSMIADEFPTSFAVSGVVKDLGLIAAAMRGADVHDGVVEALAAAFRAADTAGHGDEDMAAVVHAFRPHELVTPAGCHARVWHTLPPRDRSRCLSARSGILAPGLADAAISRGSAAEVAAGDGLARVLTGAGAGAQRVRGGVLGEAADVLPLQGEHALGVHLERGLAGPAHRVVAGLVQVGHLADEVVVAELARLDAVRAECIGHGAGVPGEVRGHAPQHAPLTAAYSARHGAVLRRSSRGSATARDRPDRRPRPRRRPRGLPDRLLLRAGLPGRRP